MLQTHPCGCYTRITMRRVITAFALVLIFLTSSSIGAVADSSQPEDMKEERLRHVPGFPNGTTYEAPPDLQIISKNGFIQKETAENYVFRKIKYQDERIRVLEQKNEERFKQIEEKIKNLENHR